MITEDGNVVKWFASSDKLGEDVGARFVIRGTVKSHDERSEEHTSELQSLMRISYAVLCLNKKNKYNTTNNTHRLISQQAVTSNHYSPPTSITITNQIDH